jgi:hypothetical protein
VPCSPFQLCSTHIVRSPCTVYKGLNCTVLHSVCMPTLPCRYLAILYSFCQLTIGFLNQRYLSTYKREYLAISLRMKRCVNIFKMGHSLIKRVLSTWTNGRSDRYSHLILQKFMMCLYYREKDLHNPVRSRYQLKLARRSIVRVKTNACILWKVD